MTSMGRVIVYGSVSGVLYDSPMPFRFHEDVKAWDMGAPIILTVAQPQSVLLVQEHQGKRMPQVPVQVITPGARVEFTPFRIVPP